MTVLSLTWQSPYLRKMVYILRQGRGAYFVAYTVCITYPVEIGLINICHQNESSRCIQFFFLSQLPKFCFFKTDYIWLRRKLSQSSLAQLAVLTALGCCAMGYVEPWITTEIISKTRWHHNMAMFFRMNGLFVSGSHQGLLASQITRCE